MTGEGQLCLFCAKVLCCVVLVKTLIWAEWDDPFPGVVRSHSQSGVCCAL